MEQDLFQLNDKVYSNNNNILLGIVSDLQQLISNSKDNLIIKRLSDIIIKLNYIIKENKKYLELIRKDISQLYNKLNNNINLKFNELNFNINQNQMMQNQMFQQQQQEIFQINQIQQFPIQNQIIQQQIPQMKITANSISIHFIDIARIGSYITSTVQCYDQDLLSSIINRYKVMNNIDSIENIIFLYNGKTLIPTLKAFEVGITKNANVYVLTKEQYEKNLINVFIKNENNSIKIQCWTYEKVNDIIERYRNMSGDNLNVEFKFNDLYLERDSPIGGAGVGNNANIFVLRGIYVNFRVSGQSGQTKPIRFLCNPGDKISDIIKEYRKLSGDYDQSKKFIFNARNLNQSLCACEVGIKNNDNIFVVSTKGIKGIEN